MEEPATWWDDLGVAYTMKSLVGAAMSVAFLKEVYDIPVR